MFYGSLWRLYWFLVVSSVTLLITVAYYTWYDIKEETLSESTYALKLISRSAHDQLRQQAAMLKILGRRLIDIGVFENIVDSKKLMDEILSDNPVFIAYGLATTSGDLVITSSNLNPETLPNLLQNPQSEESFRKALLRDNLTLGRTYYYEPLEDWIIPLRYAVRNKEGVPVAVVATAISLTSKHNPWKMMEQSDHIYIVVTKAPTDNNEYYTQYADPPLFPDSIENTYDNPYPQDAIENNKNAIATQSGMDFESFMSSEEIIQYEFFDPWLDQESIDIIIYNNEFEIFTSLSHEYTLITDKYYKTSLKYVLLFLLFNLILFYLIRYIDRIQSTSKQVLQFQATHDQLTSLPRAC